MSEQLKPCPFCGSEAYVLDAMNESWVVCKRDKCHASGPTRNFSGSAIKAWNGRTPIIDVKVANQ